MNAHGIIIIFRPRSNSNTRNIRVLKLSSLLHIIAERLSTTSSFVENNEHDCSH